MTVVTETIPTGTAFDFAELRRAIEQSDADALIRLYADDAELVTVDRDAPPSAPRRLTGREAIAAFWRDVCARDMMHLVSTEVQSPDRVSFIEECAYPDGCHVLVAATLELADGRIIRHLAVQAWDDATAPSA